MNKAIIKSRNSGVDSVKQAQIQQDKHNSQLSQNPTEQQQFQQYKQFVEQENMSTYEITKILKQNINKFYKINKIDVPEQARINKQQNSIVSFLDKFTTKIKYLQNYNHLIYEEATSGEESPKLDSSDLDEETSAQGRFDESSNEESYSKDSNSGDKSSNSEDDSSDDSRDGDDESNYSNNSSNSNRNKIKSYEQSNKEDQRNSIKRNQKDKKNVKKNLSDEENDQNNEDFSNESNQHHNKNEKLNHMDEEMDEQYLGGNEPEQDNLLFQLQSRMAKEKKNQQKDRQSSSSCEKRQEKNKKDKKSQQKSKKKSISKRNKHKKRHDKDQSSRRQYDHRKGGVPSGTSAQKRDNRRRNQNDEGKNFNQNTGGKKEVASLDDINFNFFDSHSYEIVSAYNEAEKYPDVPKIYIEDPQDEVRDPYVVYKIVVSLAKLDAQNYLQKKKKKVKNFSIIYSENVKVMIFDFYKKSTSLAVSKSLLDLQQAKNNSLQLPKSLVFKWALDKKAYPEYLKTYFSCIFRNIPKGISSQQFFQQIQYKYPHMKIKIVEDPAYIKNQYCTIVQFESIEDCEYACSVLHKQNFNQTQYKIKCNLHPKCSHLRSINSTEDKNKIFFRQPSTYKQCKLFKCRMKREWFEDYLIPIHRLFIKQDDQQNDEKNIKQKSLKDNFKIRFPNTYISPESMSEEESFQEYRYLYQDNSSKFNYRQINKESNNNFNNNSQYLNNQNYTNNSNSNQSNKSNYNNQVNQNQSIQINKFDNDPLSILRSSSQIGVQQSNTYKINNNPNIKGYDNGRIINDDKSQFQNQSSIKQQKGIQNQKPNDILKNSSMTNQGMQEDVQQQNKLSSSSILGTQNNDIMYQTFSKDDETQVENNNISGSMHSSRTMKIYGAGSQQQQYQKNNNRDNFSKQQQNRYQQDDNQKFSSQTQLEEKSLKIGNRQNIQQFEQTKKMSKLNSQQSSQKQNNKQQNLNSNSNQNQQQPQALFQNQQQKQTQQSNKQQQSNFSNSNMNNISNENKQNQFQYSNNLDQNIQQFGGQAPSGQNSKQQNFMIQTTQQQQNIQKQNQPIQQPQQIQQLQNNIVGGQANIIQGAPTQMVSQQQQPHPHTLVQMPNQQMQIATQQPSMINQQMPNQQQQLLHQPQQIPIQQQQIQNQQQQNLNQQQQIPRQVMNQNQIIPVQYQQPQNMYQPGQIINAGQIPQAQPYPGQVIPAQGQTHQVAAQLVPQQQQPQGQILPLYQNLVPQLPTVTQTTYSTVQNPQGDILQRNQQVSNAGLHQQPIVMNQQPIYSQQPGQVIAPQQYRMQGQVPQQVIQQIPQMIQSNQPQPYVYGQNTTQIGYPHQVMHQGHNIGTVGQPPIMQQGQILQPGMVLPIDNKIPAQLGAQQQILSQNMNMMQQQIIPNQVGMVQTGVPPIAQGNKNQSDLLIGSTQPLTQEEKIKQQQEERRKKLFKMMNPTNDFDPEPPAEPAPKTPSTPPTPPSPPSPPEPM